MTFVFFVLLLISASNFPFNEVIQGKVIVTSQNPPVHIKAKSVGKILAINYQPGDLVFKGDILGELENDSYTKDVVNLRAKLDTVFNIQTLKDLNEIYPPHLILGNDLQLYYNAFLSNYHHLILEASLNDQSIHDHQMRQELSNQLYSIDSKNEELSIAKRNLEVSETNYKRFQELFNKGVVSQVDLENIEKDFLMQQRQFHFLNQQYNQLILENKGILSRLQLSSNTSLKTKRNLEVDLLLSQQNLIGAIQKWEDTYLLKSPIDGRLSYFEVWGEYQNVEEGESVYSVVPDIQQNLIGKCIIPIRNAGKLKKGQKVNLKLDNYPYHEWGMVRAKVGSISQIPKGGDNPGYIVYLTINDLKTSYGKELEFHQELNGTAEILLKEVTLIERIFYQFRHLWSNREF
ncbi:HlyD family secretion protein [Christiangramia sp. OXR-203]|uniref:HlyD family secretion protein n=1 Tax=Christiangramia sp. OXR-203 TaxID=3100176 RepID=UPI002AC9C734|nr:HlyD family efflux transporter periplasmic adaptor subunit [Christiangramia sp. OXR-203]WPZ00047.1 HlyD family efflux transporter periplasmic adaptor subunit [Christiangramia sp. OXR-203]